MNLSPVNLSAVMATPTTLLTTSGATHTLQLRVAKRFWSRLRGLMFSRPLPPDAAVLFPHCTSVHTCFMFYALDLAYLDAQGRITQCAPGIKPWRLHWARQANPLLAFKPAHTLELQPGTLARLGIEPGDQLQYSGLGDQSACAHSI
jgi:uncharacterized protein